MTAGPSRLVGQVCVSVKSDRSLSICDDFKMSNPMTLYTACSVFIYELKTKSNNLKKTPHKYANYGSV